MIFFACYRSVTAVTVCAVLLPFDMNMHVTGMLYMPVMLYMPASQACMYVMKHVMSACHAALLSSSKRCFCQYTQDSVHHLRQVKLFVYNGCRTVNTAACLL